MKKSIVLLSLLAGLLGMSSLARADLIAFMDSVNKQALSDIKNFNNKLSQQFGVPVPNVDAIVKNVPNPADAFMVLQISQMANVAPEVVLQRYQRSRGQGWGRLAQDMGIRPGSREFFALKNGDLRYEGDEGGYRRERREERGGDEYRGDEHRGRGRGEDDDEDEGRGRGHGHGRGHGRD